MPNWCSNEVSIIAENEEGTEELKQFIKDCFTEEEEGDEKPLLDFEKVIPYPDSAPPKYPQAINIEEQMKHPFSKWYNDFGYDCGDCNDSWDGNDLLGLCSDLLCMPSYDVNDDNALDILDVIIVVNLILGLDEISCSIDYDDDGEVNVLDLVSMVNLILN